MVRASDPFRPVPVRPRTLSRDVEVFGRPKRRGPWNSGRGIVVRTVDQDSSNAVAKGNWLPINYLCPGDAGEAIAGDVVYRHGRRLPSVADVPRTRRGTSPHRCRPDNFVAVTPIANLLVHGSTASGSPVARGVLQHTLFCTPSHLPNDPDSAFVEHQSKAVRDYISSAPPSTHHALKRIYTGKLRFGLIIPTLGRRHGMQAGWQTDPLIWKIAKDRIFANPGCYARSVIGSYFGMATYKSYSSAESRRLRKWLAAQPPIEVPILRALPRDEQLAKWAAQEVGHPEPRLPGRRSFEAPTGRPLALVWLARFIYGSAAIAGLCAMLLLLVQNKLGTDVRKLAICVAALGVVFHSVSA